MRELRVVGVESDGSHVICQDPQSGEKFRIASDERLRAAARGDISRLGQIEIEMESALRPREIQARIRAGASVAEVAAAAGVGVDKIERFAHPVLLERTRATELAGAAHPIRHDGPAVATLAESVAEGLIAYGHNPNDADWDAWKGDDGYWIVQVAWSVGRTDNLAHWRYQPGSHGGSVDPLDDLADELTHPETIAPRRRLTPVATPDLPSERHPAVAVETTPDGRGEVTVDAASLLGAQRARSDRHEAEDPEAASEDDATVPIDFDATPAATEHDTVDQDAPAAENHDLKTADEAHAEDADDLLQHPPADGPRRKKPRKPSVPAWEDVLLGVRSNGNN